MPRSSWRDELDQRLARWKADGLERRLRTAEGKGIHLSVDGCKVVSFASNDYLGLSVHPRLVAAGKAAMDRSGVGAMASRLICGTRPEHTELERALASFKRTESALVFASGYQTALASMGALLEGVAGTTVFLDRLCHASLIDGARLAGVRVRTFKHNDASDLKRVLDEEAGKGEESRTSGLVVLESLYSMDGDVAPVDRIYQAAREHGAWLLVDEAHATGVLGDGGRGVLADVFEGSLPGDILSMGTLSKALGSQGGFLCGPRRVIETIVHSGRAFLFSTGLTPAAAASAREALVLIGDEDARRQRMLDASEQLRNELAGLGFEVLGGPGPILPIVVGDEARAVEMSEKLLQAGFWVPAVRYPTVKKGRARLRLSVSALHTADDLRGVASALDSAREHP